MQIKVLVAILLVIVVTFVGCRYGWRLFGFYACDNPNSIFTDNIKIEDNSVFLSGDTSQSAPAYVGYIYEILDGNLYIGLKYNLLFGFFDRLGRFNIQITCDTSQIKKIYLKNGSTEKLIWGKC
jgi:hypothetical protein